jgi:hypothetical protein
MGTEHDKLLKLAKRRVALKKSVMWHLTAYICVNVFLAAIYYFTTPNGYFWPIWSILGWGLGLLCHAIVIGMILRSTSGAQDAVAREYQKLREAEIDSEK